MSYSEMLEVLGVSNSFLTYHLENLGELVGKMEDGRYRLSTFGEDAMATMTRVEDIPVNTSHQSPQTKPKKIVWKSVPIALGLICIVLIAFSAYFAVAGISTQNSYNNLQNQNKQLHTWLVGNETLLNQTQIWQTGNETLLSQTQDNNTKLQNQIAFLDSNITNLQNEINNLHITDTENFTVWVNNTYVETGTVNNGGIETVAVGWGNYVPSAGYISIRVSSNDSSTFVGFENHNTTSITNSTNVWSYFPTQIDVGFGGTVIIPVLPSNWMNIWVGSVNKANIGVTITYYY